MAPSAADTYRIGQAVAAEASKPKTQMGLLVVVVIALVIMLGFERWANVTGSKDRWSREEQAMYSAATEARIRVLEDEKIRLSEKFVAFSESLEALRREVRQALGQLGQR